MKKCALLSALSSLATASFNLNTSGPDWDYTAKDLANTTSQACKDAYSADIDCDPTLLGLVASMRPAFKPGASDFDRTCTTACKDSLASYVDGVQAACTAQGDKAQESVGGGDNVDMYLDPVEIVGQIFQYTFASDCAQTANGSYCYLSDVNPNADTFSCDDECAVQFYTAAHQYPASAKEFNYYWLISRGVGWIKDFATGWTRLQEACGVAGDASSSSSTSSSGSSASTTVVTSVALTTGTATVISPTAKGLPGTQSTAATVSSTTPSSSPTPSVNAGSSFRGGYALGSLLSSFIFVFCSI